MAVKHLYGLSGLLALPASSVATIIKVDATLSGAILAAGFVSGTDHTYFALVTSGAYEIVKVTHVNGQNLTVERGIDTLPQAFPAGSLVEFVITAQAIIDDIGPIESTVQLTDSGIAVVTNPGGNIWNIHVDAPNFSYLNGIEIVGAYPNLTWTYTPPDCCGDAGTGGGTGAINSVEGEGIADAVTNAGDVVVTVPAPVWGGNVEATGIWPNINLNYAGSGGGGGTVTSVTNGTGLSITGAPAVNPTLHITATGVVAGTYGGIEINAQGQIVAVPVTLNPVSIVSAVDPIVVNRTDDAVEISVKDAAVGQKGVVELADSTDPFDPLDDAKVATPAVVAAGMATIAAPTVTGADSYSGEADGDYVNNIGGSLTAVDIPAGRKAIVYAEVTVIDGGAPLTPVDFGIAVFNTTPTKIKSNKKMTQSQQSMSFVVAGPVVATNWALVTTALAGAEAVVSYSLYVELLP